jgi:hypothetical protein
MTLPAIVIRVLSYASFVFLFLALFGGLFRLLEVSSSSAKIKKYVHSLRAVDYRRFQDSEHIMPVSLILPAEDRAADLLACVENLLALEFKQYELIVIADSGNQITWQGLYDAYRLLPFRQPYKKTLPSGEATVYRSARDVRLVVLDQKGASRSDALNAGMNVSSYPIVAVTHTALRLTRNALLKTVYAFVSDSACVYIGSFPRVGEEMEQTDKHRASALAEMQNIDRLRTLYARRIGYTDLGMYLPRQPVFGAFLKSAVFEAGGFSAKASAQETDLLLRIHTKYRREKRAYCARLLPDAICLQRPARKMKEAIAAAIGAQRAMRYTIRRGGRPVRMLPGVGYTRIAETLWPALEALGALSVAAAAALGAVPAWLILFYLLIPALLGAAQSAVSVLLEENAFQPEIDTGRMLRRYLLAVAENFGFRQCLALARIFAGGRPKS